VGALVKTIPIQQLSSMESEVDRVLTICNACRYCEGFCAVFQGMTRRLDFQKNDIHYLANLCHNCGACLHACQYAPPHEFAVNVPRAMAQVRTQTYGDYAWPSSFAGLYRRNGLTLVLALALGLALFLILGVLSKGSLLKAPGLNGFYDVFPHGLMVWLFAPVFIFSAFALLMGLIAFWKVVDPERLADLKLSSADKRSAQTEAVHAAFKLKGTAMDAIMKMMPLRTPGAATIISLSMVFYCVLRLPVWRRCFTMLSPGPHLMVI
jgi:citrate/tricarballylate utilization protein